MTISEKLQTVAENEPKVYKAGQLIVLNSSEHLKGSAFGTTISIDDISEIESALTAKLSSKNLISYPYTRSGTYTANSGTMVINADGTISLSGTPTDYCGFALVNNSDFSLPKDAIYTLSVGGNCTNVRLMVVLYGSDGTSLASLPAYPGKPVTIDMTKYTATAKWTISISRNQNNVAMTGTAYPQLELGSTATTYTPYILDYSSVNVARYGKNLIPYPYTRSGTYTANSGTMVINADGTISLSGTPTDYCGFALVNNSDFSLPKDAIYTLSVGGNCTNVRLMVVLYGSDGTSLASLPAYPGKPVTIDMTKYTATAKWTISISRNQNNVAMTGTAYPQLEFGSIATAYEPYQRQSYTPTVAGEVTGITGLYPTTTLFTDDVGAVINCGYYKSIDKTIEKALSTQEMSIALAGGE